MQPAALSGLTRTEKRAAASAGWAGVAKALQCLQRALRSVLLTLFWLLALRRTPGFLSFWF